jgi:signal transduction histidine kinase
VSFVNAAEEIQSLQRCINDIVSILALPAVWTGAEPARIAGTLLDALQSMRHLDLVNACLSDPGTGSPTETFRAAISLQQARELAEQKRTTTALHAELAHVAREMTIGELTASIAHEVNQPLSGIITNANTCLRMLAADPPNLDGASETVRRTIRDGKRASDVVTRVRALFARKAIVAESVDVNEAAREVIALCNTDLQRNRILLRSEFADMLPPIMGDRVQLQQVMLNLLTNASDAMTGVNDRPREVLMRTDLDERDLVRVTVRDTGVGFKPQDAERLFSAFYTTKQDGMGIGLSVSRSIIESHHGRLQASLNEGPGATFSFSLPREADSPFRAPGAA